MQSLHTPKQRPLCFLRRISFSLGRSEAQAPGGCDIQDNLPKCPAAPRCHSCRYLCSGSCCSLQQACVCARTRHGEFSGKPAWEFRSTSMTTQGHLERPLWSLGTLLITAWCKPHNKNQNYVRFKPSFTQHDGYSFSSLTLRN